MKSIGEISKIVKVSVSALRYYDEIGLLCPEYVDEENGYRYYTEAQVGIILKILELKSYGFSLDAIKGLMYEASNDVILSSYGLKLKELDSEIEKLNSTKDLLQHRINFYNLEASKPIVSILIVDDSDFLRLILKDILKKLHFNVLEACDGHEAIKMYKTYKPGLVIMDIGMPKIDGLEATKAIKEFHPEAKVIICSAKNDLPHVVSAMELKVDAFIPKPFEQELMISTISKVLDQSNRLLNLNLSSINFEENLYKDVKLTYEEILEFIELINDVGFQKNKMDHFISEVKNNR